MNLRIGHGYDIHRIVSGRPLVLGGVRFETDYGLEGHSDADCLTHAICDALLGAASLPDIGHFFPNTDPVYKDIDSQILLQRVTAELATRGWSIVNIDASLVAETPKIYPRLAEMKAALACSTGLNVSQIGLKATTNEGIDQIGQGLAIAAHAVALIQKNQLRFLPVAFSSLRLLCLFAAILGFTACTPRETSFISGNRNQMLHRGMGPEPADLDPQLATTANDYTVLSALFEGLVAEDPVDLHPVPGVAERWELSPDNLTYTFHLRSNAKWSNGNPVTARDFLASWRRVLTPSLAADNASMLYIVQGAEAFNKGRTADFSQVGFSAPDERTVRITLEHPASYFLSLLQHWIWWPVPVSVIEKNGPVFERGNHWTRPETFVSNGPFTLKEWRTGQRIEVAKSATYWDAARVHLNGIRFYPIEDVNAEERAFRSGQLHITEALPVGKVDAYRHDHRELLRIDPYLGTYYYSINVNRPFLNETKVRRALALAIDRSSIVENVLRGGQQPAGAFTPPNTAGYTPAAVLKTDIPEARRLLTEAGYPGGKGAPVIELLLNTSDNHRLIAEAIHGMLKDNLGLDVRLLNMEGKSVLAARRSGDFQLLRSSWIGDYADPSSFLSVWTSDSGNNHTGWSNATYDQLLYQAARTTDDTERLALFQKAEALLVADTPLIPIYYYTHVFLIQPSVKGWYPTLLDHHPYKQVRLE